MTLCRLPSSRRRDRRSLLIAAVLAASVFLLEVAGGIWTGSLALLADASHALTDLLAMMVAYAATVMAGRPPDRRRTWGYHRLEILSALTNGLLLLLMAVFIAWEAVQRLRAPTPVASGGMLVIAVVGLMFNLAGVMVLSRASGSLNVRGARWHLAGDSLASVGVILAAVVIALTGMLRFDPAVSLVIVAIIVFGAVRLLREAVDVLLESAPAGLNRDEVAAAIRELDGVLGVHDLHIWSITTGMPALSGHVTVPPGGCHNVDEILTRVKVILRERFAIDHTTIQVESEHFEDMGVLH
ncbi:MAG: cation diffusion facilitator family transporter [Acidobacteria bacterium]|nr:cation diffusion facilitator family transporter [Acidobacteriota bacterium]